MAYSISGTIEAEDFDVLQGVRIVDAGAASGSKYVEATSMNTVVISTSLDHQPGTYDLKLSYFDEDDGAAKVTVKVDGVAVDSWTWDEDLGSSTAGVETLTSHTIAGVSIDEGSIVTIEGTPVNDEPLRIDRLDLVASGAATPPSTELATMLTTLPSFPGAEGFGATTAGGRGGAIVKVTNLNDSGAGSLRWALEDLDKPRIVLFDVGGLITLKDSIQVNGDVTVAGQTAPGSGVTIRGGRLQVVEDDAIIRGLKFRPGDGSGQDFGERDGISVGINKTLVERVVIDSNSMTWATDENTSVWSGARDVTYSNNIIAEGLYELDASRGRPQHGHADRGHGAARHRDQQPVRAQHVPQSDRQGRGVGGGDQQPHVQLRRHRAQRSERRRHRHEAARDRQPFHPRQGFGRPAADPARREGLRLGVLPLRQPDPATYLLDAAADRCGAGRRPVDGQVVPGLHRQRRGCHGRQAGQGLRPFPRRRPHRRRAGRDRRPHRQLGQVRHGRVDRLRRPTSVATRRQRSAPASRTPTPTASPIPTSSSSASVRRRSTLTATATRTATPISRSTSTA